MGQTPVVPGNIDLYERPKIPNPKGGISTVESMGFLDEDPSSPYFGKQVLVPLADEGRILSEEEAIAKYYRTPPSRRRHLGIFNTPDESTVYAIQLHDDYAAGKYERRPPMTGYTLGDLLGSDGGDSVRALMRRQRGAP